MKISIKMHKQLEKIIYNYLKAFRKTTSSMLKGGEKKKMQH